MSLRVLAIDATALLRALTQRDAAVLASVLDTRSGAVFQLADPLVTGQDNEAIEDAMDQEPERYAQVPVFDREYRLMCAWAEQLDDETLGDALISALRGDSAFRAFGQVLDAHPRARSSWTRYRHQALVAWATAWLHSLGVEPEWHTLPPVPAVETGTRPAPRARLALLHVMALGQDDGTSSPTEVHRTITTRGAAEARQLFKELARELCELRGEPWTSRYVRNRDSFERGNVRLRHDAERVHLVLQLDTDVQGAWLTG